MAQLQVLKDVQLDRREVGDGIEGGRFGSWSRPKTALEWELLRVARHPGPGAYAVV